MKHPSRIDAGGAWSATEIADLKRRASLQQVEKVAAGPTKKRRGTAVDKSGKRKGK